MTELNSINTPEELLQAYTALFLFLGGSVSMTPGESGLPHLCEAGLLRNLPVESRNSRFTRAVKMLRAPCPLRDQCHLAIGDNYKRLLVGDSTAKAYPAASHWLGNNISQSEQQARLVSFYGRYNYHKAEECRLSDDHLGIELLFLNLLIEKYLTEDDDGVRAVTGRDILQFINTEMLSWLPQWADAVIDKSSTKCYTAISDLITGGVEDVRDIMLGQKLGL